MRQFLRLAEISQILVIGEKGDGVFSLLEVVSPVIEGVDDGEQFAIIDIVILFCRGKGLGEICARVEVTIFIMLHEDPSAG